MLFQYIFYAQIVENDFLDAPSNDFLNAEKYFEILD